VPEKAFDPLEHYLRAKRTPRSARGLISVTRSAVGLARRANPGLFYAVAASGLVVAALLGLQVLLGKLALEAILRETDQGGSVLDALPALAGLVVASAVSSVASAFQTQGQRLLADYVARSTLDSILDVTTTVDLETYESPEFFDDLQRVQTSALTRPLTMTTGLIQTLSGLLGALGLGAALLTIEPLLVPVLVLSALPLWLLSRRTGRVEFAFNVAQTPAIRLRYYLVEILTGRDEAKELRAFDLGGTLKGRWHDNYAAYLAALRAHVRQRLGLALAGAMATVVVTTAAFALLISFVLSGRLDLAGAGAGVLAIRLLTARIQQVFGGIASLFESSLFLSDLERFLTRKPSPQPSTGSPVPPFEELVLDDVHFAYPGSPAEVLHGVSLRIKAGEVVALVGENGSGKTTLAKLLGALFTPTGGRVLWDGTDLAELNRTEVREHVGFIFQDFIRYQLSARENIGFGRAEAVHDDAGIQLAAQLAGADQYLQRLPEGYETTLGKTFAGAQDLSIGQWQRIALARAFFRGADFLVLDEPTASLDARAEHQLFEQVAALAHGRSVLLISHRFSTVKSADRIYVLHEGEVVEEGSHAELMALGGRYAELFELQAGAYR
jgi:ATP-binding cassette subfamily B protein